jgi:histidyl-tRNA synthetase
VSDIDIVYARRDERTLPSAARSCIARMETPQHTILGWRVVSSAGVVPSTALELHIAGTHANIADALLVAVAHAILEDAGIMERSLHINYLGATESSGRFVRDVNLYLRKHIESISPTLRARAGNDPLGMLVQLIERGHPATPRAPQSMEYLGEEERKRLWEILEYIESSGHAYELKPHLLGSRDCWSHTLFEISSRDPESGARITLASGGRYDPLASRIAKTPLGAAMISITCETRGNTTYKRTERTAPPNIYIAHLGVEARKRILSIIDVLRRAGIPVRHGIWHERINDQMQEAQAINAPYLLIVGHKEAMDGTVLVRTIATNIQEAVPMVELPQYLKRHHIALTT